MHLTRAKLTKKVPIARKGTKYVVRPLNHINQSITVLSALRDMLGLAKTKREVKYIINNKLVKINDRIVKDYKQPIHLFNIFEADKKYKLTILPTGRFNLSETKENTRIAKVIGKKTIKGNQTQINLHDGTNILSNKKINIGDSLNLDFNNKLISVIPLEKNSRVFVQSGRNVGFIGNVIEKNKKNVVVQFSDRSVTLNCDHVIPI